MGSFHPHKNNSASRRTLRKTHGGWRLESPTPGAFRWTSPLGYTYERTAVPLLPIWNHPDTEIDTETATAPETDAGTAA